MDYTCAIEKYDLSRIDKLNKITEVNGFWDASRKLCRKITSDHSIKRWQALAEARYLELIRNNEVKNNEI